MRLTPRERVGVVTRRMLSDPHVHEIREIAAKVGECDGTLLAAGLAFNALFAIIPALLFVVGLLGFVMGDPTAARETVLTFLAQVPAVSRSVDAVIAQVLAQRGPFSIVGIIGVAWASSGFYGSLDGAMRRLFPGTGAHARGIIEQRLRGLVAVVGLVVAVIGTVVLGSVISLLDAASLLPAGAFGLSVLGAALTTAVFVAVAWLVYVIVPTEGPGPRTAFLPAVAVGVAVGALTALYSALTPLLVGSAAGIGILAALFGALVWLRLAFLFLVYGAAWARIRRDRQRLPEAKPA